MKKNAVMSDFFRNFAAQNQIDMEYNTCIEERNEALRQTYNKVVSANGVNKMFLNKAALIRIVVEQPAPKFYCTPEWAQRYIAAYYSKRSQWMLKNGRGKLRRDMILDLVEQYEKLQAANPDAPKKWLYDNVVEQPAKSFYVSARRAAEIIFNYAI